MFTVVVGVIFLSLFPDSVMNPVSVLGIRVFTEKESYILTQRVLRDDPSKAHAKPHVTGAELKKVVSVTDPSNTTSKLISIVAVDKLETSPSRPPHDRRPRPSIHYVILRSNTRQLLRIRKTEIQCHGIYWILDLACHQHHLGHDIVSINTRDNSNHLSSQACAEIG